jgi:hypothetical protein
MGTVLQHICLICIAGIDIVDICTIGICTVGIAIIHFKFISKG